MAGSCSEENIHVFNKDAEKAEWKFRQKLTVKRLPKALRSISVNNQGTPTSERGPHYHYLEPSFKDMKPSENTQTIYQPLQWFQEYGTG